MDLLYKSLNQGVFLLYSVYFEYRLVNHILITFFGVHFSYTDLVNNFIARSLTLVFFPVKVLNNWFRQLACATREVGRKCSWPLPTLTLQ